MWDAGITIQSLARQMENVHGHNGHNYFSLFYVSSNFRVIFFKTSTNTFLGYQNIDRHFSMAKFYSMRIFPISFFDLHTNRQLFPVEDKVPSKFQAICGGPVSEALPDLRVRVSGAIGDHERRLDAAVERQKRPRPRTGPGQLVRRPNWTSRSCHPVTAVQLARRRRSCRSWLLQERQAAALRGSLPG